MNPASHRHGSIRALVRPGLLLGLASLVIAVAIGLTLRWRSAPEIPVATVRNGTITAGVPVNVRVVATATSLRAPLDGPLTGSLPEVGRSVSAGEHLFSLEAPDREAAVASLEARIRALETRLEEPRPPTLSLERLAVDRDRLRARIALGEAAASELDSLDKEIARVEAEDRLQRRQWETDLVVLRQELAAAEAARARRHIRAPTGGIISEVLVTPDSFVMAGTPLARLVARPYLLEGRLLEEDSVALEPGMAGRLRLSALGEETFPVTVETILPEADPVTREIRVLLAADLPEERIRPGMTGEASLVTGSREGVPVMPRRALLPGDVVYRLEGNRVRRQPVVPGLSNFLEVEIRDGLDPGDRVVTDYPERVRAGSRIRPIEAKPAARPD
ncbi:MAG: efflux RND transporter periplasmic adaptor subunit [Opitutales bacterium]